MSSKVIPKNNEEDACCEKKGSTKIGCELLKVNY